MSRFRNQAIVGVNVAASFLHMHHGHYVSAMLFGCVAAIWLFIVTAGAVE